MALPDTYLEYNTKHENENTEFLTLIINQMGDEKIHLQTEDRSSIILTMSEFMAISREIDRFNQARKALNGGGNE